LIIALQDGIEDLSSLTATCLESEQCAIRWCAKVGFKWRRTIKSISLSMLQLHSRALKRLFGDIIARKEG